jgi:hypothetical protein
MDYLRKWIREYRSSFLESLKAFEICGDKEERLIKIISDRTLFFLAEVYRESI